MKFFTFLFFVLSLILYIEAPYHYNRWFCELEMYIYIICSFIFLKHKIQRLGFFNFYVLFLLAFWAVNYLHPVFIYPDDELFLAFSFPYDTNVICSGVALAQLGISCFMYGSMCCEKNICIDNVKKKLTFPNIFLSNISIISSLFLITYVFAIAQISYFTHLYPRLMKLLQALLVYNFCVNLKYSDKICVLILENKKVLFAIIVYCITLIVIGSRGGVIYVLLSVFAIYYIFYKRISYQYILSFLFLGLFFMTIVTFTRISSVSFLTSSFVEVFSFGIEKMSSNDVWIIFTDWVVNARNLYDAMVYPNSFGYLYGSSYLSYVFVFVPFAGSYFVQELLGVSTSEVSTGHILSAWNEADYGLGTNIIGDLYMNFAEGGVILGMLLLGVLSSWAENCKTINQLFVYISLLVYSFTLPRASILGWTDLWAFLWIMKILFTNIPALFKARNSLNAN